jgi:hypothetical protein
MIAPPKHVEAMHSGLPEGASAAREKRDGAKRHSLDVAATTSFGYQ